MHHPDDQEGHNPNFPHFPAVHESSDVEVWNIARPMLEPPAKSQLLSCVEKTTREIIKAIGTKDIAAWYSIPKSDAEPREEAEQELKDGLCDKAYWGEEHCRRWKLERDAEAISPELLAESALKFKKKNPKLPTLPPNSMSGPAFKPFKPVDRPPTTPPILSDGTFALPFKPGSTEAMHDNIRQLLDAGKFGGPKRPDGWDDDLIPRKKSPTGPTHPVADAELDKFIKLAKKAVLKKPEGITDEKWKAFQAALRAAAGSEESSHDEL
ncbi:hypothetical protein QFC21_002225 [Naganishia friedmannii]|uniref:Uncharacterized protein n=1 Tax=Naganishia friedmannii TaxID=89922 RepID=A0ACC2VWF9_9TREE|nr:hypothetical protein QFC21_002225 [Naganishia friedmannii]